jgi:curved DNA-binding protein CbpA
MGNTVSVDPSHVRIYQKLLAINNPATRVQMLETLMVAPEYVASARRTGIYAALLQYIQVARAGGRAQFPGEAAQQQQVISPAVAAVHAIQQRTGGGGSQQHQLQHYQAPQQSAWQVVSATPANKALNYFQQCLVVLGLGEEETLTDERLKSAYKKAAVRVHPDKGGTEQQFEAVTRAYAYLSDILKRITGTKKTTGALDAPAVVADQRATEDKKWDIKPVSLNPKNLNMTSFNSMFEQTRLPDPDDDGYGDWLKGEEEAASGPKFSGKFNRDVFMKTFEDEARRKAASGAVVIHPEMMALTSSASGVELGRGKADTYTAPANASLHYTDLRDAYTKENTLTSQVANVRVEERNMKDYSNQYKKGPAALTAQELAQLEAEKSRMSASDNVRQRRAAEDAAAAQAYFERMKQLVITS